MTRHQDMCALEAGKRLDPSVLACRKIFAACPEWGAVGRELVLRGDFDGEPEMQRLIQAYRAGRSSTLGDDL
jgi:hypothetical protein